MAVQTRIGLIVVAALAPLLAIELYGDQRDATLRDRAVRGEALRLARLLNDQQGHIVEAGRQLLTALVQNPRQLSADPQACGRRLDELNARLPQYLGIGIADAAGDVVCATRGLAEASANVAEFSFFRHAVTTRDFVVDEYQIVPATSAGVVRLARPVLQGDQIVGVAWAALSADWLAQLATGALSLPEGGVALIADRTGTIVVRLPQPELWAGRRPAGFRPYVGETRDGIVETIGLDGVLRVYGYVPAGGAPKGLFVAVGIDPRAGHVGGLSPQGRVLFHIAAAATAVAVAWLLALLLIARPLTRLERTVRRWKQRDFSATTGMTDERSELGRLGVDLDQLVAQFRDRASAAVVRERRLRKEVTEQRAALAARNHLLLAAGHDLRQPLQILATVLSRLEDEPGAVPDPGWIARGAHALDRLSAGLTRLVEAARLQSGEPTPRPRALELARILGALAIEWRSAAEQKGLALIVEGCDAEIYSDPEMLTSILENLVGNAIKYTDRGSVSVTCRQRDRAIEIIVADTGPGIPSDHADAIFDEFFQLDSNAEGLGLGLSIARHMAASLGHQLYTVPRAHGSEFVLAVPLTGMVHEIAERRASRG